MDTFFKQGEANDLAYKNVRDEQNLYMAKEFIESLWPTYREYADSHFREDAPNHFLQRFWEMYLGCTLLKYGLKLEPNKGEGPDFSIIYKGTRIWIEAIAPEAGCGPDQIPTFQDGKANIIPTEKILLRFTSALIDKQKKLNIAMNKQIVKPKDLVLLAINSRNITYAPYGAEIPYFIKALLPIGNLTISINPSAKEKTETYHQYRPVILKENRSQVSTAPLLDPKYSSFSGVIHSGVDWANHPLELGNDFDLLHNPSCLQPLPSDLFSWCRQFKYINYRLNETTRTSDM